MISLRKQLIDTLVETRKIDRKKLERMLESQKAKEKSLGVLLIEEGLVEEQHLLSTLAKSLGFPPIHLSRYQIDPALAADIPEAFARKYQLVPVSKFGQGLTVAMADPLNVLALDDLTLMTSLYVHPVIASAQEIEEAIRKLYQVPAESPAAVLASTQAQGATEESPEQEEPEEVVDLSALGMAGKRAPIVKVVDLMISEALKARASDIHVEPYEKEMRIRYRIDGSLVETARLPKRHQNAFLTRLKIMSRLDITENRRPQDGRFKVRMENREVDFRVSVLPVSFGNKVVMRALDKRNLAIGLDQLGFLPDSLRAFRKAILRPYGMILVTGPTGSGKSTTLYSVLNQMNEVSRNILTVEDPVEYQVDGITQVQVNPEIQLTFANTLRAFLRQAPDVVLVGEIRDGETADIAIKASLTGQIVLSTLHTNDAASSIVRLTDMGVDPFLLASSLIFVAAQRLSRQVCGRCKVEEQVKPEVLERLGVASPHPKTLFRGKGCPACRQTGFYGRFAILEAMLVDDPIREMIIARRPASEIKAYALQHGMRTLRQEGLTHCMAGRTSLEEVLRVTSEG